MDTFTESQLSEITKLRKEVQKLSDKVTLYESEQETPTLNWNQQRAQKSLVYHQTELKFLEEKFKKEKEQHLAAIEAAQTVLNTESPLLNRARTRLRLAEEKVSDYIYRCRAINATQQENTAKISKPVPPPPAPPAPTEPPSSQAVPDFSDPFGEWDTSDMTPSEIKDMVLNRQRRGETIPTHLLHHLPASEARALPEAPSAPIIKPSPPPQPVTLNSSSLPPPPKLKKGVKTCRPVQKEVGPGIVLYSRPSLDGDGYSP